MHVCGYACGGRKQNNNNLGSHFSVIMCLAILETGSLVGLGLSSMADWPLRPKEPPVSTFSVLGFRVNTSVPGLGIEP